jgi:hypothetical protein
MWGIWFWMPVFFVKVRIPFYGHVGFPEGRNPPKLLNGFLKLLKSEKNDHGLRALASHRTGRDW